MDVSSHSECVPPEMHFVLLSHVPHFYSHVRKVLSHNVTMETRCVVEVEESTLILLFANHYLHLCHHRAHLYILHCIWVGLLNYYGPQPKWKLRIFLRPSLMTPRRERGKDWLS